MKEYTIVSTVELTSIFMENENYTLLPKDKMMENLKERLEFNFDNANVINIQIFEREVEDVENIEDVPDDELVDSNDEN